MPKATIKDSAPTSPQSLNDAVAARGDQPTASSQEGEQSPQTEVTYFHIDRLDGRWSEEVMYPDGRHELRERRLRRSGIAVKAPLATIITVTLGLLVYLAWPEDFEILWRLLTAILARAG